ncbi:hypothetical protein LX32DRAFT_640199, partial [Colletotrichum zoysiae]
MSPPPALPHHLERPVRSPFHREPGRQATNDSARSGGTSSVAEKPCVGKGGRGLRTLARLHNLHIIPYRLTPPRSETSMGLSNVRLMYPSRPI